MAKEIIKVGVANRPEQNLDVEDIKLWEPKNINYFNDVAHFKNGETYYTMKREDFKRIFNK